MKYKRKEKYKTLEAQLAAVKENGFAIKYIHNPLEEVQLKAVKDCGGAIEYIHNPSEAVQLAAVKQDGYAIEHIDNPSDEVQLEAVKEYGLAIEYIHNPSEESQLEAVKQHGRAIEYIHNPSEDVIDFLKNEHIEIFDEHFEEVNNDSPVEKHIPAEVWLDGYNLGDEMIDKGLTKAYLGGKKAQW
jgi:hypothetical protein